MPRKKRLSSMYLWIAILIILFLGCFIALKLFFGNAKYHIDHVRYTTQDIKQYNNIDMYTSISTSLSGESLRYRSLFGYHSIAQSIYRTFPYIDTISFTPQGSSTILADIVFLDPLLVVQHDTTKRAVYSGGYTIPLFSGNTLGNTSKIIRLPIYLTGLTSLSGLFFDIGFDKIYNDRILLDPFIATGGFISYLPGGEKYVLVNGAYRYYFNAKKDIQDQIDTLLYFKNNYSGFKDITQVDIGSLSYPIIHQ